MKVYWGAILGACFGLLLGTGIVHLATRQKPVPLKQLGEADYFSLDPSGNVYAVWEAERMVVIAGAGPIRPDGALYRYMRFIPEGGMVQAFRNPSILAEQRVYGRPNMLVMESNGDVRVSLIADDQEWRDFAAKLKTRELIFNICEEQFVKKRLEKQVDGKSWNYINLDPK
jgi:hypothetical protein